MILTIVPLPDNSSALSGHIDEGILEGKMLLAADKTTLDLVSRNRESGAMSGRTSGPSLKNRKVYFAMDRNDGNGTLTFEDKTCASFEGTGSFPDLGLGSECEIVGFKVQDVTDDQPRFW
jgi:hypothetical protein